MRSIEKGKRKKERFMIGIDDSDSESDSEEELNNFVVFFVIIDFEFSFESDVELERELDESYKEVREILIKFSMENFSFIKEKERLEVELFFVRFELQREIELVKESVGLIKEKLIFVK